MDDKKDVLILAIESSCDETAAAVVKNGREVLSNVISSQIALHTLYGGVVPEIASRKHIEKINFVIKEALDRADEEREDINTQAAAILKDPRILAAAVEANRRVLTPLWFELIEEGRRDGSIKTAYAKELSELLPLINFWLLPSVFPADPEEIVHKCRFIAEVLSAMGLPIVDEKMYERTEKILGKLAEKER